MITPAPLVTNFTSSDHIRPRMTGGKNPKIYGECILTRRSLQNSRGDLSALKWGLDLNMMAQVLIVPWGPHWEGMALSKPPWSKNWATAPVLSCPARHHYLDQLAQEEPCAGPLLSQSWGIPGGCNGFKVRRSCNPALMWIEPGDYTLPAGPCMLPRKM